MRAQVKLHNGELYNVELPTPGKFLDRVIMVDGHLFVLFSYSLSHTSTTSTGGRENIVYHETDPVLGRFVT